MPRYKPVCPADQSSEVDAPLLVEKIHTLSSQNETQSLYGMPHAPRRVFGGDPNSECSFGGNPDGILCDFGAKEPGSAGHNEKRLERHKSAKLQSMVC